MKDLRKRRPTVPRAAAVTIRQRIVELLQGEPRTALEISAAIGVPVREVYSHLEEMT